MSGDAVAEVDTPGKPCGRTVGVIGQAGEEAAQASDRNSERQRRHELAARGTTDTRRALKEFNADNSAGNSASNRMPNLPETGQPHIETAEQQRSGNGAECQRDEVA